MPIKEVMDRQKFCLLILMITLGLMQGYFAVARYFSGEAQMKISLQKTKEELEAQRLRRALAHQELLEFKQHVATLIPELEDEDQKTYGIRNLASVVVSPDIDKLKIEKGSTLFERGKKKFSEGEYKESNSIFQSLISRYPDSAYIVESYFLFAEGRYQDGQYEECLKTIEAMVNLFPENDLTGFALLRMGQVLAQRDRYEDAEQIYRTVIENFKDAGLNDQTKKLLKEITL